MLNAHKNTLGMQLVKVVFKKGERCITRNGKESVFLVKI